ncbi:MAG: hypothetical protein GXX10_10585 [Clostridiaceae bacterium]|nr:hypothetical protein [Clostridiaceae bacterium]
MLGKNYSETTETDDTGSFGEDIIVRNYNNGIAVSIGKTSGKVVRISASSSDFKTESGIKVGDTFKTVSETFKSKYKEAVSRQTNKTLEGWFLMEDGTVMIFDFKKEDGSMVNENIKDDSKVEEIILSYWKYFD